MDKGRKEYRYLWFIENYNWSYSIFQDGEGMSSPKFTIDGLEGTTWELLLIPNGLTDECRGNVSLFLCRCKNDAGPEDISVEFQLSVVAVDGSVLHSREFKFTFKAGKLKGSLKFLETDEIFLRRKTEYLAKDTLILCCKMWKGEGDVQNIYKISARSQFILEKISFLHAVESFSTLQPNVKQTIEIRSHSEEGSVISSSLYLTPCSCGEIMIEIVPSEAKQILLKCKLSLLDRSGNMTNCGGVDYRYDAAKISIHKLPLSLRKEVALNRKFEYLPDDKLSLLCECIFATGFRMQTIEETLHGLPLTVLKRKCNQFDIKDVYKSPEKFSEYPSVSENMKTIYIKQHFTDVDLKTKTKSFPAHKIVLCASSPVFEAMLTSDMKEKNTACIQVDDLEDDTVQQLLLFLYSDSLETLQWKSANQLYYAADKYQILKLKAMCSSFLTENLNASNSSELLLLADTHNDTNLKKIVEDFILEHEAQVFGSNGWEKLIEKNPLLVIKTMHLKYKRKNEAN